MLSRQYNLKGKESFENVEKEGKIYQSESFGLAYQKREDKEGSKFGFVVSKKIHGDAVHRNRIKRAMSEAVRFSLTEIKNGYNFVFLAKQTSTKKSTDEIMKEVTSVIRKAGFTNK
ncbi:MAG: ribonuclease P protein component [Patescibacteria group bacterium]